MVQLSLTQQQKEYIVSKEMTGAKASSIIPKVYIGMGCLSILMALSTRNLFTLFITALFAGFLCFVGIKFMKKGNSYKKDLEEMNFRLYQTTIDDKNVQVTHTKSRGHRRTHRHYIIVSNTEVGRVTGHVNADEYENVRIGDLAYVLEVGTEEKNYLLLKTNYFEG